MKLNTKKNYIFSYFVLFIGFLLSCLMFYGVKYIEKEFNQYKFKEERENYLKIINSELDKNIDLLNPVKHLFLSSKNIDRQNFKGFAKNLLEDNNKIISLSWVPLVKDNERKKYEKLAQREGYKKFQFTQLTNSGDIKKRETSSEYYPIYYIEPVKENVVILGLDLYSNENRAVTILNSLKKGETSGI